jgi:hypothetical protein
MIAAYTCSAETLESLGRLFEARRPGPGRGRAASSPSLLYRGLVGLTLETGGLYIALGAVGPTLPTSESAPLSPSRLREKAPRWILWSLLNL